MKIEKITRTDISYQCPVCKGQYRTQKEAETCAKKREPKYGLGDWVMTIKDLNFANPAFDDWFGGEDPYDKVLQGSFGKIREITDENQYFRHVENYKKKSHPEFFYLLTETEFPLSSHGVPEQYLKRLDDKTIDSFKRKVVTKRKELDNLEQRITKATKSE